MSFIDAIGECFFNFMNFRARAARAEYWWWVLFYCVVVLVALILDLVVFGFGNIMPFFIVTYLALIFPSLTVTVRRLHDTNRSGWWLLLLVALCVLTVIAVFVTGANDPSTQVSSAGAILVVVPAILVFLGSIVLFIFMLLPSTPGNNRYGPNRYAGDKY